MRIKAKFLGRRTTIKGQEITFITPDIKAMDKFHKNYDGNFFDLEVGKEIRSLNSNAYMWTLCHKIARKLLSSKEEVYKDFIRKTGSYIDVAVKIEEVDAFIKNWERGKLGWFCEVYDGSKDWKYLRCYKGSSSYDKEEMSQLLEEVVTVAKEYEIPTMTPDEIAEMESKVKKNGY